MEREQLVLERERGEGKPADDFKGQCVPGEMSDTRWQGRCELGHQTEGGRTRPKTEVRQSNGKTEEETRAGSSKQRRRQGSEFDMGGGGGVAKRWL